MYNLKAYQMEKKCANIEPFSVKREWMSEHMDHGAYKCFPLTLANKLGFSISFPEDIIFEWNGEANKSKSKIKFYSGEEFCYVDRGLGTIAFNTKTLFKTEEGVSCLIMPAPNYFIEGIQSFTTILATSFFTGATHVVNKITKKNSIIEIKANTPVASILPISILQFQNTKLDYYCFDKINNFKDLFYPHNTKEYALSLKKYGEDNNKTSDWYIKAIDHKGNKIGSHEVNSFNFNIENIKNV
jgi:hypothetical protein